ncbi:hypothetical protein ACLOJK_022064 [Asimina triloba]
MAPPDLPKLFISLVLAWALSMSSSLSSSMCMARWTPSASRERTVEVRLQEGGSIQCWNSLLQLRACTGDLILFFVNGKTYLGPSCCGAIGVMQQKCWPTMLLSLGFTSQEGDILKDYCDGHHDDEQDSPPPSASPIHALATAP